MKRAPPMSRLSFNVAGPSKIFRLAAGKPVCSSCEQPPASRSFEGWFEQISNCSPKWKVGAFRKYLIENCERGALSRRVASVWASLLRYLLTRKDRRVPHFPSTALHTQPIGSKIFFWLYDAEIEFYRQGYDVRNSVRSELTPEAPCSPWKARDGYLWDSLDVAERTQGRHTARNF